MRIHPISLTLRFLKGQKTLRAAPFYGKPIFPSEDNAAAVLRKLTGQNFGTDAAAWDKWLRKNRSIYYKR